MIFAIIDLGTNTFNLLVAECFGNQTFKKRFNTKIAVKLGEGTINSGYISKAAFQRGIEALKHYQRYLIDYKVEKVYAFGTSAIRSASNGHEFVSEAKIATGINITVIDGNEEADLIYYGNRMAVNMSNDTSLIMDIGGGSTEFIIANKQTIFWKHSFLLGAARLLDKFKPSDPITPQETIAFNKYLVGELQPLYDAVTQHAITELIGSSGAFDSVVDMIGEAYNTTTIHDAQTEYGINLAYYHEISRIITSSTIRDRKNMKGLIGMRVDMIVVSILLIDFVLKEFKLNRMRVSTFSLKEGVISKQLGLSLS